MPECIVKGPIGEIQRRLYESSINRPEISWCLHRQQCCGSKDMKALDVVQAAMANSNVPSRIHRCLRYFGNEDFIIELFDQLHDMRREEALKILKEINTHEDLRQALKQWFS